MQTLRERARDFVLAKYPARCRARERAEMADYYEEVVLPELEAYGEEKTCGFKRLIGLLRQTRPDRAAVVNFKYRLMDYVRALRWAGLEAQAEDLVVGAELLEGRAKDFLLRVSAARRVGFDAFYAAYVEAALWSSNTEDGTPLDEIDAEIEPETLAQMRKDCLEFYDVYGHLLCDAERDGHDFWLTRNHHGSGFWDRDDLPEATAEALTDAAHEFGEAFLDYDPERNVIYQV